MGSLGRCLGDAREMGSGRWGQFSHCCFTREMGSPFSHSVSTGCTIVSCYSTPFFSCREAAGLNFLRTVGSQSGGVVSAGGSAPVTLQDQGSGHCLIRGRCPAPGRCRPQKILSALHASKWWGRDGVFMAPRLSGGRSFVRPKGVAIRCHGRSQELRRPIRDGRQPRNGSR
jgi:hypothetical protein